MARYTIELCEMLRDDNFKLFDFDYDFYLETHKPIFEQKFIDYYMFNEIGFETVFRFKHYLKEKLNRINRYYEQLYKTEVRSQSGDIDFMLNKDLIETFENNVNVHTENLNTNETSATGNTFNKESYLENGNADINLNQGALTGVTGGNSEGTTSSNSNNTDDREESQNTKLISKGNIGVTSSGSLLEDWRKILINIDEMIIKECQDLFMMIY